MHMLGMASLMYEPHSCSDSADQPAGGEIKQLMKPGRRLRRDSKQKMHWEEDAASPAHVATCSFLQRMKAYRNTQL